MVILVFFKDSSIRHETQDCKHLKKEINDLLSRGYLSDLMGNDNRIWDCQPQWETLRLHALLVNMGEPCNEDIVRTINTIHGRPEFNGNSNNTRKRYTREVRETP